MDDQSSSNIEKICRDFFSAFDGHLTWKWEERFKTALAEININNKENIHTILESFLNNAWDRSSSENAPDDIKTIINKFGSLHTGQLLYASDNTEDDFLFAAWWPWGNGSKISIRVAPFVAKQSNSDSVELIKNFRTWFQV